MIELGRIAHFRLGAAEVRPSACEIVGPGGQQVLEPRVMQVLVVLAESVGQTVTRDVLIERCWDGRIVSEDAINRVIVLVRRAARGAGTFGLQTIPKVGFRLLAEPTPEADGDLVADAGSLSAKRSLSVPSLWVAGLATVAAVGALMIAANGSLTAETPQPSTGNREPSAAAQDLATRGAAAVFEGTPQQVAQGVNYYRAATRQFPQNGMLWGSLAMATTLNQPYLPPGDQAGSAGRIREAAERALALDPAEPHAWAAIVALSPTFGAWSAKNSLVVRGLAHAKPGPPILRQEVIFLSATGRTQAALAKAERLYRMHGMVPFINADLLKLLMAEGRLEEAATIAARAKQLWPHDNELWRARFQLALLEGDAGGAQIMAEDRGGWPIQAREADMVRRAQLAHALATGQKLDADRAMAAYELAGRDGRGYLEEGIVAAAALRRPDAAFDLSGRLYGKEAPPERFRFADHVEYDLGSERATDFWFGPFGQRLWGDARFLPLMQRIGLVGFWRGGASPDLCGTAEVSQGCLRYGLMVKPPA